MGIPEGSLTVAAGPVRVCIDSVPLLLRSAGVKTYVYYWTEALLRTAGANRLDRFPFLGEVGECTHERSVAPRAATLPRLLLLHLINGSPVPLLNAVGRKYDVFHASQQLMCPPRNTRLTTTIYDMTCWMVPEAHRPENVRASLRFADAVTRRADGHVAISESTRRDAVRILGIDERKVTVIYPGVSDAFFDAPPLARAKPYALFVGTIEPRKNVGLLLDAWQALPAALREEYDLVIAGSPGWGDRGVIGRLRAGGFGIDYLGYVGERELPSLTAGAALFVYPSLYEGFGLPVAQAMAAGVAVLTSRASSLPEVAGDGAILVDPASVEELASALRRCLETPALRAELARAGRSRAERYRWDVCARESWKFFAEVAGV